MNLSFYGNTIVMFSGLLFLIACSPVQADGMVPETTVIIFEEDEGEASINVRNSDSTPALLHSVVVDIPEDTEPLVIVTPPVARIEAGEKQRVRVLAQLSEPLKTQRLKRITFEGIAQNKSGKAAVIGVTIRQNLPLILNPSGLAKHNEPWTLLEWSVQGDELVVSNDSPYVVRLAQTVRLNPHHSVEMTRPYILPGQRLAFKPTGDPAATTSVTIFPATVYGFTVDSYDAPIVRKAR